MAALDNTGPLLKTKLYIPRRRRGLVPRPRLSERLNRAAESRLTLVSAPAGSGKTTLLAAWLSAPADGRSAAWLSLDPGDNDPASFWTYLIAALQTVAPGCGAGARSLLQAPQPPPIETILATLLYDLSAIPDDVVLVLDDYHVIDARDVQDGLVFLLEHLPPQMHLVIATRADPALPLARLRAQGELVEIRAADLRFTPDEAAAFLRDTMGVTELAPADVTLLEERTEGWAAGLQLAALSLRGRSDAATFIAGFAGSNRHVVDYLAEEVLRLQPQPVRRFLFHTSVPERICGALADALTDAPGAGAGGDAGNEVRLGPGQEMLEELERSGVFLIPLDEERRWYRYHHLFADVLRAHLKAEQPDAVADLHRRASAWHEQNGLPADAVRHALAAGDFGRAADLIELAWPAMRRSRREATVLGWVKALPDELVRARPVLSVVAAWALLDGGELEAAEARLRDAERWLGLAAGMRERPDAPVPELGAAEMVVVDEQHFRSLPAAIANARAYRAQALGDVPATVQHARQALELLPEGDHYERGTTAALLGLAYWASGDLEAAHRTFADGLASLRMGGGVLIMIGGTVFLADMQTAQGRLHEAVRTYERALQLATAQGEPALQGTAELYLGLSELHRERGDLEAARQHLLRGEALRDRASSPGYEHRWCIARARMQEVEGDLDGALALLQEAERLYYRSPIPDLRPVAALRARVWVAQGRLTDALGWVRERGLSADDDLSYRREYEHVTLARVLIARYRSNRDDHSIHEAARLLERLLKAAEAGGRIGSAIEILVLQALAHEAQGDIARALVPLERALTLAEPEGYVQVFADEGTPMAQLLREAASRGIMTSYTGKLLATPKAREARSEGASRLPMSPPPQPLVEPLSPRELEVLRLFKTDLSGPELARELVIALSTVRTHTKRIYSKLNVTNRRAAVKRAAELGLL